MWNVAHIIGPSKVTHRNQHWTYKASVRYQRVTSVSNGKTMSLSLALFTLM